MISPIVRRGNAPLILSFPHSGAAVPDNLSSRFVTPWLALCDTDWHIDRLYDFVDDWDVTWIQQGWSRSTIDVNRDPSGQSLYPGQITSSLCPIESFDGQSLYKPGQEPDDSEIGQRTILYFQPFHHALQEEIVRLRQRHERVFLYDCHSIRSTVARLFDGVLPQYNIGTNDGASCDPRLTDRIVAICAASQRGYVVNGRFKGGWITRHYGCPSEGVHAIQMELAMRGYLNCDPLTPHPASWPPVWSATYAASLQNELRSLLTDLLSFAAEG